MRRIGLLGGSFDPPHLAHIALAQAALERLQLDEVRFVVAGQPWQKPGVSTVEHRLAMTQLALQDQPNFVLETLEAQSSGPSYTIDTLTALRERYGAQACLVLLMGSDQYRNLPTWHRHEELLQFANLAVAQRAEVNVSNAEPTPSSSFNPALPSPAALTQAAGLCVSFVMPPLAVSSSQIRAYLGQGNEEAAKGLLAPQVLAYSRAHFLYTNPA